MPHDTNTSSSLTSLEMMTVTQGGGTHHWHLPYRKCFHPLLTTVGMSISEFIVCLPLTVLCATTGLSLHCWLHRWPWQPALCSVCRPETVLDTTHQPKETRAALDIVRKGFSWRPQADFFRLVLWSTASESDVPRRLCDPRSHSCLALSSCLKDRGSSSP